MLQYICGNRFAFWADYVHVFAVLKYENYSAFQHKIMYLGKSIYTTATLNQLRKIDLICLILRVPS
jgi:hypothetical protein